MPSEPSDLNACSLGRSLLKGVVVGLALLMIIFIAGNILILGPLLGILLGVINSVTEYDAVGFVMDALSPYPRLHYWAGSVLNPWIALVLIGLFTCGAISWSRRVFREIGTALNDISLISLIRFKEDPPSNDAVSGVEKRLILCGKDITLYSFVTQVMSGVTGSYSSETAFLFKDPKNLRHRDLILPFLLSFPLGLRVMVSEWRRLRIALAQREDFLAGNLSVNTQDEVLHASTPLKTTVRSKYAPSVLLAIVRGWASSVCISVSIQNRDDE